MVTVARLLNLTLVVPELDKKSFWDDPRGGRDACIQGEHQQIDLPRWVSGTYGSGEISLPGGKLSRRE